MKSFVKLEVEDGRTCYLLTEWQDGGSTGFKLTLLLNQEVWKAKVSETDLNTMRQKIKMDLNTFSEQTLQALTNTETYDIKFNYQINKKHDDMELVWKKHVPAEDITFQLGKAVLHQSPSHMMNDILDHCIECTKTQKAQIDMLKTDNDRLSQERVNALKRLEKCVVAKEDLEKELYSKFAAVLNSKKEKIRELKETGGRVNDRNHAEPGPSSDVSRSQKRPPKRVSKSDDDTTDDEKPTQQNNNKRKADTSVDDDSLVLDDGSDDDKHAVVARPKRSRGTNRKTPNKPVLPKVSSKDSNTSLTERPSSARKLRTTSGNTNTLSTADDADAMLDEI